MRKRKRNKSKPEGPPASAETEPTQETTPQETKTALKTEGRQPREHFLQGRLARAVLEALRNNRDGLPEAKLDYIFGFKVASPERDAVFQQLKALNLAEVYPTGRGGKLWVAKFERTPQRGEEKVEVKAESNEMKEESHE